MKIKRYFAADMREAIKLVREDLGAEAVILSNRKLDGGIEISAATDYDENWQDNLAAMEFADEERSSHPSGQAASMEAVGEELKYLRGLLEHQLSGLVWGEQERQHPLRAGVFRQLGEIGLSQRLAQRVADHTPESLDAQAAWQNALDTLSKDIYPASHDLLGDGGVYALLGPTGVGKTTTVAKLAARFALRHGAENVALLTTDNFRVGAHEQLRTFARIMGIPMQVVEGGEALADALEQFRERRLVLIDTAGMSQRDIRLSQQVAMIKASSLRVKCYLVLSAAAQSQVLEETVRAFRKVAIDGTVVTKLDESASLGGVISSIILNRLPVAFVTEGQRVPEDIAPARAQSLLGRAVALAGQQQVKEPAVSSAYAGERAYAR